MTVKGFLHKNKTLLLAFVPPLVLLPLVVVGNSQESRCAYGLILMAFYWTTETFPVSVTALMPVFLFPIMRVSKVGTLASKYFNAIIFNLIGALTVAIAIERWNVHKRFALRVLLTMGTTPKWLMLGFMLITFFLSMWLLNTATTSMMIPIAQAVLTQLMAMRMARNLPQPEEKIDCNVLAMEEIAISKETTDKDTSVRTNSVAIHTTEDNAMEFDFDSLDPESQKLCKAMLLSICYAANCGGVATLTGTGPNLVMKGHADLISDGQAGLTFASWFVFAFPVALINVLLAWLCIQVVLFGVKPLFRSDAKGDGEDVKQIIQTQYQALGKLSFAEKAVLIHFVVLVLAWFTLNPEFIPGWASLFPKGYLSDAVPAMFIACLLFVFPSYTENPTDPSRRTLLDWKTLNRKFPWGVLLLLGGGFSLAHACKESGLSLWLAKQMSVLTGIPTWTMCFLICLIVSLCTEVTSNNAICSIFMPILADLGKGIHVHPVYFMLPAGISTSFAFMLPVATPPNTIAFSYGYLRIIEMVKVGWILNILCVIVVSVAVNTWGMAYFRFDVYPEWAKIPEVTSNTTFLDVISNTSAV